MRADPGNVLNNAFAAGAIPVGKVEVDWPRTGTWSDITAYCDVSAKGAVTYQNYALDPAQGLAGWGTSPMPECTITLDNGDGKFSESLAGSSAATYGLYGLPVRVSLGYLDGATPRYVTVFTGTVVAQNNASARDKGATLACRAGARFRRRRATTVMHRNNETSTLLAGLALAGGITDYAFESGLLVIPYAHLNNDNVIDEMARAAASEAGVLWIDADEKVRFSNAGHWVGRTVAAAYTPARMFDLQAQSRWSNCYNLISVTYQPRRSERDTVVYSVGEALSVPAGGSIEHLAEFRWPLDDYTGMELVASSSGGEDVSANVSIVPASPPGAQRWPMTISNSHTRLRAYITKLDIVGKPLSGRPSATWTKEVTGADEDREWEAPQNWNLQSETQAAYVGDLFATVMHGSAANRPRAMYVLPSVQGLPLLEPLDLISVTYPGMGLSAAPMIVLGYQGKFGGAAYEQDLYVMDATDLYAHDKDSYFRPGVSLLGTGRMWI